MFIKAPGKLVHCMDRERSYSGYLSRLECSAHRIFQQSGTESVSLPGGAHGQTCQQHDRNRMPSQTFFNLSGASLQATSPTARE